MGGSSSPYSNIIPPSCWSAALAAASFCRDARRVLRAAPCSPATKERYFFFRYMATARRLPCLSIIETINCS